MLEPGSAAYPDAPRARAPWLGTLGFVLSIVSLFAYFAFSQGLRDFVAFLIEAWGRLIAL